MPQRGNEAPAGIAVGGPELDAEDVEDLEDAPDNEVETAEEEILDQATAARTIAELKAEIGTLKRLEVLALALRRSGEDRKWCELAKLLSTVFTTGPVAGRVAEAPVPYGSGPIPPPTPSPRQKLVLFTEHRDTLSYLEDRVSTRPGRREAVVMIHGGMGHEDRMKAQEAFKHDPEVQVLLATDAAGEGINLQRAHLMVNYDLPWNPNRIEQRFGCIHRIGQTEVCHLWNLVAEETRITHVPAPVRNRDRLIGVGEPVLPRYERIAFEKDLVAPQGQPMAAFLCPDHPLLDATIDLTLERHRDLLRRGAVLVDDRDAGYTEGQQPLIYLASTAQTIATSKCRFVLSNGHGIAAFTQWFDDIDRLDEVDWDMVYQRYWSDNVDDMDRQRRKQSEFLVHRFCPWSLIAEIGVLNAAAKALVEGVLAGFDANLKRPVNVRGVWYY